MLLSNANAFLALIIISTMIFDTLSTDITILSISNIENSQSGKSVAGAQWLAIQEINNDSTLLPNYTLKLEILEAHLDRQQALLHALNVTQRTSTRDNIYFPIIAGPTPSSLSTAIAPILSAFDLGLISAASTSVLLSQKSRYPFFTRTIPSDELQAHGIITLCLKFNWNRIGIVYIDNEYGLHLSLGIQALATEHGIDVTAIAVSNDSPTTYQHAAKQIKELKLYIIVCILSDDYIELVFEEFVKHGISGYPRMYLGVDAWLDDPYIDQPEILNIAAGAVGTAPWISTAFDLDEYDYHLRKIVAESLQIHERMIESWRHYFTHDCAAYLHNLSTPDNFAGYGYDALYVLARAIQQIDDHPELYDGNNFTQLMFNSTRSQIIQTLHSVIVNTTDFIGSTGRVHFDKNGDRIDGFFAFGNVLSDGRINYFGYFYKTNDTNGTILKELNESEVIWPSYFVDGNVPRSEMFTYRELQTIPNGASIPLITLCSVSIIIALLCIIITVMNRGNIIIKSGSWKLNCMLCCGAILGFVRAIMYSFDEDELSDHSLSIVCNLRVWFAALAFTLVFAPLFCKSYRLSTIFLNVFDEDKKRMDDKHLMFIILKHLAVDILLLIILTAINPLIWRRSDSQLVPIDDIQQTQYEYGSCTTHEMNGFVSYIYIAYAILVLWKLAQSLWGIHVGLSVSRLNFNTLHTNTISLFLQFDETGIELLSIFFACVVFAIAIPIYVVALLLQNILLDYLVDTLVILLIGNFVVSFNLFPRIYALFQKRDDGDPRYKKSYEEQIEERIEKELRKLAQNKKWLSRKITDESSEIVSRFGNTLRMRYSNDKVDTVTEEEETKLSYHDFHDANRQAFELTVPNGVGHNDDDEMTEIRYS